MHESQIVEHLHSITILLFIFPFASGFSQISQCIGSSENNGTVSIKPGFFSEYQSGATCNKWFWPRTRAQGIGNQMVISDI